MPIPNGNGNGASRHPAIGQLLSGFGHGGSPAALEHTTTFGYLFPNLNKLTDKLPATNPSDVVSNLDALGVAMAEPNPVAGEFGDNNSTIPAVYTYLGQFIDHDLTSATDSDQDGLGKVTSDNLVPADRDMIVAKHHNNRFPALNLDSVYSDGPTFDPHHPTKAKDFYDGITLKVGTVAKLASDSGFKKIPLEDDNARDLPRTLEADTPEKRRAPRIGDTRNDENLIVAQLHVAFLRFHNAVVERLQARYGSGKSDEEVFLEAQRLVQWHYQWIVLHDYLPSIALPGVVDKVHAAKTNRLVTAVHERGDNELTFMPLEFAAAGFRFGHSMVRGVYDYNRNFGRGAGNGASFNLLFAFTGTGGFLPPNRFETLPDNWPIEWDRFTEFDPRFPDRFSRRVDTNLADPLFSMKNQLVGFDEQATPTARDIQVQLALRNLRRGYMLSLPTGQAVARELDLEPLSESELLQNTTPKVAQVLRDSGFLTGTPLWYYVLKEAEVRADGNSLAELGSTIVAETIIGQLRLDPDSYLNAAPEWVPEDGVRLPDGRGVRTIKDLFRVAGVFPTRP